MVKFYSASYSYDYSFPAVCLAYNLRYPNPYSTHVLSTDVIEQSFDPATQRLHIVRLHLKRSKLPSALFRLLPRSFLIGGGGDGASGVGADASSGNESGDSQSYILERSTVDIREGWMETESRNLDWTKVLSVVERQVYRGRKRVGDGKGNDDNVDDSVVNASSLSPSSVLARTTPLSPAIKVFSDRTDVTSTVTLLSRLGQTRWNQKTDGEATRAKKRSSWFGKILGRRGNDDDEITVPSASSTSLSDHQQSLSSSLSSSATPSLSSSIPSHSSISTTTTTTSSNASTPLEASPEISSELPDHRHQEQPPQQPQQSEQPQPKQSFLRSWSTASLQRSIEIMGLKRAHRSQPNAKEGMEVVLDRLRQGGLVGVLEGMRRDRELVMRLHYGDGGGGDGGGGGAGAGLLGRNGSEERGVDSVAVVRGVKDSDDPGFDI